MKWCDLVLEGGGAKIPGLIGALEGIKDRGFTPLRWAGSSSGAIVASFGASGYSVKEMIDLILKFDFKTLRDGPKLKIFQFIKLIRKFGIYDGEIFYEFIKTKLAEKGVKTFGDLKVDGKYLLAVTATDISTQKLIVFPFDAKDYGIHPDDMEVALAVRISMSIPGYFVPIVINDTYFVDGGTLSNFPIWIWDSVETPRWPTFGLLLDEKVNHSPIENISDFGLSLIKTFLQAYDKRFFLKDEYKYRTIRIPTLGVYTTDFDISINKKLDLIKSGNKAADEFFKDWSWEEYKRWFHDIRVLRKKYE